MILFCAGLAFSAVAAKKKPPAHPIDLNSATIEQLEQLPGIGPVTAKKIIEFREKSGPFRKVEDLLAIPRITKVRLEKLRPYVTVKQGKPAKASASEAHENKKLET
jgi:competence protein ComEA